MNPSSGGIRRNTIREAFRLLANDGVLVYQFNRGVFVSEVTGADVRDIYRVRRLLEPGVVRSLERRDLMRLEPLQECVDQARAAAAQGDWPTVGTANLHFHRAIVGLAASPRLDAYLHPLSAQIRLVFAVIDDPQMLYEPFVERNAELLALLREGRFDEAADYLEAYLSDSERWLLAAFDERDRQTRTA